ncbi:MAG TPA: AAA family ATPase [Actinomycetota bacterium]|jgi:class 3 adenylate cyclase/tetratricopeptide (TPR) repeat protein
MAQATAEGTLTVLFTDIEGSTDLGRVVGDHGARAIVRAHERIVREQVEEHGGRVVKSLGDGLMVAFSSARMAVGCAIAIQRSLDAAQRAGADGAVPVRIGVHCGEAILEGDDIHGSVVNAAARITGQAKAQQVLVSDIVKALVGGMPGLRLGGPQTTRLKGFDDEWRLFEVEWREETSARSRLTPLVGREHERAELSTHLNNLAAGSGALVLIGGEPGVGKTRLAQEIANDGIKRGHRVLTGRCYDVESPIPYLPFIELLEAASKQVDPATFRMALGDAAGEIAKVMPQLRNLYDDILPGLELPPEQERRYLFNSISEFVTRAASARPLILILDDLHWADASSLALLERVAEGLSEVPVLILGTYRNVELDTNRPLARVLDGLLRRRLVQRVNLKRLGRDGVAGMLERLAGQAPPDKLVDAIYEESEGNPFFVEEVFRHLSEQGRLLDSAGAWRADVEIGEVDVPESIRLVIGRRLEALDDTARRALCGAAVLGRTFEYAVLEEVAGLDGDELLDALEHAEQLSLVQPLSGGADETRFEFVHELIRQTLLSGMTPPRRHKLHRQAAQALERLYASDLDTHAAEITNHLRASGARDPDALVRFLTLAGERAQASAAFADAAAYFEEALEFAGDGDPRTLARILVGLGHAKRSSGSLELAMPHWRRALAIYEELGDTEAIATVAHAIVMQLGWDGRWDELLEITARALGFVGETESKERALLLVFGAVGLGWAGEYESSKAMLEEAIALSDRVDDPTTKGQCIAAAATHFYAYGQVEECIELARRGAEILEPAPAQWNYATAQAFVVISLAFAGRFGELAEELDKLEEISTRLGFGGGLMFAHRSRMIMANSVDPSPERFLKMADEDIELCRTYDLPWLPQGQLFLATARAYAGDMDGAIEMARIAARDEPPGVLYGWGLGLSFFLLALAGRKDEAMEVWEEARPLVPERDGIYAIGRWGLLGFVVESLWLLGERDEAARHYETLAASPRDDWMRWDGRAFGAVRALAADAAGAIDGVESGFEAAFELAEQLPNEAEKYALRLLRAMVLAERGDGEVERARQLLAEAEKGLAGFGIHIYDRQIAETAAKLG